MFRLFSFIGVNCRSALDRMRLLPHMLITSLPKMLRKARSHLAWVVLVITLATTVLAVLLVNLHDQQETKKILRADLQQHGAAIAAKFDMSAQVLRTTAAMLMLNRTMQRASWRQFQQNLSVQGWPDGMLQLGYAQRIHTAQKGALHAAMREDVLSDYQVHPLREHPMHIPILFIAPDSGIGKTGVGVGRVGFDLLAVPAIASLLEQATKSGTIAFSSLDINAGTPRGLMVLPVFPGNARPASVELRQQQVIGYVFALLQTDNVLRSIDSRRFRTIQLLESNDTKSTDAQSTSTAATQGTSLLIGRSSEPSLDMPLELYGTTWRAIVVPSTTPRNGIAPTLIAVGGTLLSVLLFGLLRIMTSTRRTYRSRAETALNEIRQLQDQLSQVTACTDRAIIMIDRRQRIITFNPAAENIFGTASVDVVGTDLVRFLPYRLKGAKRCATGGQRGHKSSEYRLHNDLDQFACRANGEHFPFAATIVKCQRWGHEGYLILLTDLTTVPHVPAAALKETASTSAVSTTPVLIDAAQPFTKANDRRRCSPNETETERLHCQLQRRMMAFESAREEQQKRLAREMHDDFGQLLTAMKMDLVAIQMQLATANHHLSEQLSDVSSLVDAMVVSVRRIMANLPPQHIDQHGLIPALEILTKAHARRHKVACRLQITPQITSLNTVAVTPIYRIVQEALNNIAKHARATEIDVCIEHSDNRLHLRVSDNGDGISTFELQKPGGFGLIGMRERIITLNGEMALETACGVGTTIRAVIPIDGELAYR